MIDVFIHKTNVHTAGVYNLQDETFTKPSFLCISEILIFVELIFVKMIAKGYFFLIR